MKVTIKDRIVAHRSAPDVYDPPSFEQMADRIEKLEANLVKAVEALSAIEGWTNNPEIEEFARTTLAELTGGKDG